MFKKMGKFGSGRTRKMNVETISYMDVDPSSKGKWHAPETRVDSSLVPFEPLAIVSRAIANAPA